MAATDFDSGVGGGVGDGDDGSGKTNFGLGDGDDYLSAGRAFVDGGNGNGGGDDGDDGGELQWTGGPRWKRRGGVAPGSKTIISSKVDFGHRGLSGVDLSGGSRDGVNFVKGSRVPPRVLPQQPSRHRASAKRRWSKLETTKRVLHLSGATPRVKGVRQRGNRKKSSGLVK